MPTLYSEDQIWEGARLLYQQLVNGLSQGKGGPIEMIFDALRKSKQDADNYLVSEKQKVESRERALVSLQGQVETLRSELQHEQEVALARLLKLVGVLSEYADSKNWRATHPNGEIESEYGFLWVGPNGPCAPELLARSALTTDVVDLVSASRQHEEDSKKLHAIRESVAALYELCKENT